MRKLVLGEQKNVHIGQPLPKLLFSKCLNPPSQQEHTSVQIQSDRGCSAFCVLPAKETRYATPALFLTDSSAFHT